LGSGEGVFIIDKFSGEAFRRQFLDW